MGLKLALLHKLAYYDIGALISMRTNCYSPHSITHSHTHTHTQTHTHTHADTHIYTHTSTHTHKHMHTLHTHADTHTQTYTHSHTCTALPCILDSPNSTYVLYDNNGSVCMYASFSMTFMIIYATGNVTDEHVKVCTCV